LRPASSIQQHADTGRREGLPIEAACIHDLKAADRQPIDVSAAAITASEQTVETSMVSLRQRTFHASPAPAAAAATSTTSAAGTPAKTSPPAVHNRYRASTQAAPTPPRRSFGALLQRMRRWRNHTS